MNSGQIFTRSLARGDVYYNIQGSTRDETIRSLSRVVKLPKGLDRKVLSEALIEREGLASTAMGEGFALPHPRHQLIKEEADALVAIGYLDTPVDWASPDGKPVSVVFLVLSAGVDQHLATISALACLTQSEDFKALIKRRPSKSELLALIPELSSQCDYSGITAASSSPAKTPKARRH
jgi:PTS system nitrogen regulatory IIA component